MSSNEAPKTKKRKRDPRSRSFLFTLYYEKYNMTVDTAKEYIFGLQFGKKDKIVFQLETCPTTGRKHMQVWIYYDIAIELKEAKKRINPTEKEEVHIEIAHGKPAQCITYHTKDASRNEGPWFVNVPVPREPIVLKYEQLVEWQRTLVDELREQQDDRLVYWIYDGVGGAGKSNLQHHMREYMYATEIGQSLNDAAFSLVAYQEKNGFWPQIVYINLAKEEDMKNYSTIEKIKDGSFFSGKYESCSVFMPFPHLVVFANCLPQVQRLTWDRWEIWDLDKETRPNATVAPRKHSRFFITTEQSEAKRRRLLGFEEKQS